MSAVSEGLKQGEALQDVAPAEGMLPSSLIETETAIRDGNVIMDQDVKGTIPAGPGDVGEKGGKEGEKEKVKKVRVHGKGLTEGDDGMSIYTRSFKAYQTPYALDKGGPETMARSG
jgi:hypothetical protein